MKPITVFETLDGSTHRTIKEAVRHLDKLQTVAADKMLSELRACDGKHARFVELLQNRRFLELGAELLRLTIDQEVIEQEPKK